MMLQDPTTHCIKRRFVGPLGRMTAHDASPVPAPLMDGSCPQCSILQLVETSVPSTPDAASWTQDLVPSEAHAFAVAHGVGAEASGAAGGSCIS